MSRIEPGTYRARCTGPDDVQWGYSANGNLQIGLVFVLLDEPYANRKMSWRGSFANEKSTEFTLQALENCGWKGEDPITSLDGVDSEEVELVVEDEFNEQNGQTFARVRWVNRPSGGKVSFKQPASKADLSAHRGDIVAAVLERRRNQGTQQPAKQQPQQGGQRAQGGSQAKPSQGTQRQQAGQRSSGNQAAQRGNARRPQEAQPDFDAQEGDDDIPF